MRDHRYIREDGTFVPVSQMTLEEIHDVLADDLEIHPEGNPGETEENVRERLRIELLIRNLGL